MLTSLTRTICPLLSLAALALGTGCGKKIAEPKAESDTDIQQQVPNSLMIVNLTGAYVQQKYPENGDFSLPYELKVNHGSASTAGKSVSVYYNLTTSGDYDLKCLYKGNAGGDRMFLYTCYNPAGSVMGTLEQLLNEPVWVNKDRFMKMEASASDLDVGAIYQVRWTPQST
jgi:hypothetical protein